MTTGSKNSDKFPRPGSGSRPNSSDSAAAIDGSDRIGPGKSGRHHNYDEDKSEAYMRRSHDSFRENDQDHDDRRGRHNSRERVRENRDRGEDSDRGRDSSTERSARHREDHRLRNERSELSPHEATASARMHGYISRGEQYDHVRSDRPSSRPSSNENESHYTKRRTSKEGLDFDQGDDMEALDINKPAQPSREARLQDRKERLRSTSTEYQPQVQEEHKEASRNEDVETSESKTQEKKIRAPSGPRPAPRKAADLQDDDDSDGNLSDSNRKDFSRPLASTEIDDLRPGALTVNLDDSDDDGGEMDFKVEIFFFES